MHQENLQKTSKQDKLDLLMRQIKRIQTEMNVLQEQQDGLDSLVCRANIVNKIFLFASNYYHFTII